MKESVVVQCSETSSISLENPERVRAGERRQEL